MKRGGTSAGTAERALTSKIAKLVKWLQPQTVSLSVDFWTKQPSEFQPPKPSAGNTAV